MMPTTIHDRKELQPTPPQAERHWHSIWLIWLSFVTLCLVLGGMNLYSAAYPMGDVLDVYRGWTEEVANGSIPGIDAPYVYPIVSLVPMLLAGGVSGGDRFGFGVAWLVITSFAWAVLIAYLTLWKPRSSTAAGRRRIAWWTVAALAALGPIALGRIDSVTAPLAVLAMLALRRHPALASAGMTLFAWMKIWTVAPFAAAFLSERQSRRRLTIGAFGVCAAVLGFALTLGGWPHIFSFVTEQTGRGLQVESVAATPFVWLAALGVPGYEVYYSFEILTFQLRGEGTDAAASILTPFMVVALALIGAVMVLRRPGSEAGQRLLMPLAGSFTLVLIVCNKVGSPQFSCWIIAIALAGLLLEGERWRAAAFLSLAIALLTQWIYPWGYDSIQDINVSGAMMVTVRNALELVLCAWMLRELWRRTHERSADALPDTGMAPANDSDCAR